MTLGKTIPARRSVIIRLAEKGILNNHQMQKALVQAGIIPNGPLWKKFITTSLLALGVAFLLSGVVFFFAFNWHLLHKFTKLGSIGAILCLSITAGFIKGQDALAGRLSWIAASVMVGVYLAVFGQIYQTGADAWELFALWSLLIAGWTATSFYLPQWILSFIIAETATTLAIVQLGNHSGEYIKASIALAAINTVLYFTFELFRLRGTSWLEKQWFTRLMATAAVASFLLPISSYIFEFSKTALLDLFSGFTVLLFLFFTVSLALVLKKTHDLYILAVAIFSLIVYITDIYINMLDKISFQSSIPWIVLGLFIVAQAVGAVYIIRKSAEYWKHKETVNEDD